MLKTIKIEKNLCVSIYKIFTFWESILNTTIASPSFSFYKLAYKIEKEKKQSVLEYIYSNNLDLNRMIDIKEFYNLFISNLKIDDALSLVMFKALDRDNVGKVLVESICHVINSYRDDYNKNYKQLNSTYKKLDFINQNSDNNITELKESCFLLNYFLIENSVYNKLFEETINKDFTSDPIELIKIMRNMQTNNSEVDFLTLIERNNIKIENILNFLKRDDGRIYKDDFNRLMLYNTTIQNFLDAQEVAKEYDRLNYDKEYKIDIKKNIEENNIKNLNDNKNNAYINNNHSCLVNLQAKKLQFKLYSTNYFFSFFNEKDSVKVLKYSKYNISKKQSFWISKLNSLLNLIKVTPKMLFIALVNSKAYYSYNDLYESNHKSSINKIKEYVNSSINVDSLVKKLKIMLPINTINATELSNIADSLDINKNRLINEYDMIELLESNRDSDIITGVPINTLGSNNINNNCSIENKQKENNNQSNIINFSKLPIKGNYRIIDIVNAELNKLVDDFNKDNNSVNYNTESKDKYTSNNFVPPNIVPPSKEKLENTIYISIKSNKYNYKKKQTKSNKQLSINNAEIKQKNLNDRSSENMNKVDILNKSLSYLAENEESKRINYNLNTIKNFVKSLDLLDSGEWSFIEIVENIEFTSINKNKANYDKIPVFEFYNQYLMPNFNPFINKLLLLDICKIIDNNNTGLISIRKLIYFLLENMQHKSTILCYKYIGYFIEVEKNMSVYEYFSNINLDNFSLDNKLKPHLVTNYIFSFINFTKYITKNFDIPVQIVNKMFYEITDMLGRPFTIGDIIDIMTKYTPSCYIENNIMSFNNKNELNKLTDKDNEALCILEKNNYQDRLTSFTIELCKAFPLENLIEKNKDNKNYFTLRNSIDNYLKLDSIKSFSLLTFRENFVNPLNMDYTLGIAFYQMMKSFSGSNLIKKDDVYNTLDSFILINKNTLYNVRKDINTNDINTSTDYHIKSIDGYIVNIVDKTNYMLDIKSICYYLELNGPELIFCFNSLSFSSRLIPILSVIKKLEQFYPYYPKKAFKHIAKELENLISIYNRNSAINFKKKKSSDISNNIRCYTTRGLTNNITLAKFIYKYSSKNKFCYDLIFKHLASVCDFYDEELDYAFYGLKNKELYIKGTLMFLEKQFNTINLNNTKISCIEHEEFFSHKLELPLILVDGLFNYLLSESSLLTKTLDNATNSSYNISVLVNKINKFRISNDSTREVVFENTKIIEYNNFKHDKLIKFLKELSHLKKLSFVLDKLNLSSTSNLTLNKLYKSKEKQLFSNNKNSNCFNIDNKDEYIKIPIIEVYNLLLNSYNSFYSDRKELNPKLKMLMQSIDTNKKGYVSYLSFINRLKEISEDFEIPPLLHLKYISLVKSNEFKNEYKDYLLYKNLTLDTYLTFNQFFNCFSCEMLNDSILTENIFDKIKEYKGKNLNTVSIKYFIQLIFNDNNNLTFSTNKNTINNDNNYYYCSEDEDEITEKNFNYKQTQIKGLIKNNKEVFTYIFNSLDMVKNINYFGKINANNILECLSQNYYNNNNNNQNVLYNNLKVNLVFDKFTSNNYSKYNLIETEKNKIDNTINNSNSDCINIVVTPELITSISKLISYFTCINRTLFDVFKFLEFLYINIIEYDCIEFNYLSKINLKKHCYSIFIKKYTKDKSKFNKEKAKNYSLSYNIEEFQSNYCINAKKELYLGQFVSITNSVFDLNNLQSLMLYYYTIDNMLYNKEKENKLNIQKDSLTDIANKINIITTFEYLNILPLFKPLESNEDFNIKRNKLSNKIKDALIILASKLSKESRFNLVFSKYDVNNDKILSREEFFNFLKDYLKDETNNAQKLDIIKLADINNDDTIDYIEFYEFILKILQENKTKDVSFNKEQIYNSTQIKDKSIKKPKIKKIKNIKSQDKINKNNNNNNNNSNSNNNNNIIDSIKSNQITLNEFKTTHLFKSNYNYTSNDLENLLKNNLDILENSDINLKCIDISKNLIIFFVCSQKCLLHDIDHWDNIEYSFIKLKKFNIEGYIQKYSSSDLVSNKFHELFNDNLDILSENNKNTLKYIKDNFNNRVIDINSFYNILFEKKIILKSLPESIFIKDFKNEIINYLLDNYVKEVYDNEVYNQFLLEKLIDYDFYIKKVITFDLNNLISNIDSKNALSNDFDKLNISNAEIEENINVIDEQQERNNDILVKKEESNNSCNEKNEIKPNNKLTKSDVIKIETSKQLDNNEDKTYIMKDYVYSENDFYIREYYYSEDKTNKKLKKRKYKTILLSEEAALKKCEELFNNINDYEGFSDDEFGDNKEDNNLMKESLYFPNSKIMNIPLNNIEWLRLNQIVEKDEQPVFLDSGADANDVKQGNLGDCWFISALSGIATKDHLLRGEFSDDLLTDNAICKDEKIMLSTGVYPPLFHGFRSKKIYCFKFYKVNNWFWVIIDDKLPCFKHQNKLIYGGCKNSREFWVPLIEKAYAKLHGSYESLKSGTIDEGLVDLTGLISEKLFLDDKIYNNIDKQNELWKLLLNLTAKEKQYNKNIKKSRLFTKNNTIIGCSVLGNGSVEQEVYYNGYSSGIISRHAYTILDAFEFPNIDNKVLSNNKYSRLLRIRNPWGHKEWNGKWSDNSIELKKNKKKLYKMLQDLYIDEKESFDLDAEDGTFFIEFEDFFKIFSKIFMCKDIPSNYVGISIKDTLDNKSLGGIPMSNTEEDLVKWSKNPQYYIKVKKSGNYIIILKQKDGRMYYDTYPFYMYSNKTCLMIMKYHNIGKTSENKKPFDKYYSEHVINDLIIINFSYNITDIYLDEGEYIIVPCFANNSNKDNSIDEFWLHIYFEDSIESQSNNTSNNNINDIAHYKKKLELKRLNGKFEECKIIYLMLNL